MKQVSDHALRHRPLVLVETLEPYPTVLECAALLDAGCDVVVCSGPRCDQLCPVLDGLTCPFVRDADLVVNAVTDHATQAAIVDGIRGFAADVPIVVIAEEAVAVDGCIRHPDLDHLARRLRRPSNRHRRTKGLTTDPSRSPVIKVVP